MRLCVRQLVSVRVFAEETSYGVHLTGRSASASSDEESGRIAEDVEKELRRLVGGRAPQMQQLLVMRGRQSHVARSDLEKAVLGLQLQL
ncbi:hypothetical protein HYH02_013019 [Chlamydomonas schloesseri]|uniref:Uncharacterized protein n=1 Tax=Chlamydomonas schloesseri TaxID=2026947 RepID=A0A835W165_9CHLO|nr:hypothetical protein HYH02_013019 [Chlamydomonas schloesseri]|eukprot:KAG2432296.1 hypothetical protein HYH02_013019 [Chlamydomonas schloesseri]